MSFSIKNGRIGPLPTPIPTVVIGTQEWMLRNLDVTTYRDGTPIPEVTDNAAWADLTTGAWCYVSNNSANGPIYGKLYNWYAVNDAKGLAPLGYHIPSNDELTTLFTYLDGELVAGAKLKETGITHWQSPNSGATNSTGWTGLPGGFRDTDGNFYNFNTAGVWWSSTQYDITNAWSFSLSINYNGVGYGSINKNRAYSIRLIKD